jgi:hypothetical protein
MLGIGLARCNESGLDARIQNAGNIMQEVANGTSSYLGIKERCMLTMGKLLLSEKERVQGRRGMVDAE